MNFNPAHWHLLVNHLPITGGIIVLIVLLAGIAGKKQNVIITSYWLFVLLAVFAVIASQTGEGAEHFLHQNKLGDHDTIEEHVQASVYAEWTMVLAGVLSL